MDEKIYLVEVTETLQRIVKVKAESLEEAERIVKMGYLEGVVELDAETLVDTSFDAREIDEYDDLSLYKETLVRDEDNYEVYWETKEEE